MSNKAHQPFDAPEQLHAWLLVNHASESELWVRIFKKATGQPTVTRDDCVGAAIRWGWIDGVRNALDKTSFLQRLTPRRALGHRLRRQRHHGDTRRLFGGAATGPHCPRFLRHSQTPEAVHIYHRLHSAKRPETRQKRTAELLAKLARGESL